jgi:hypothetical protein
MRVKPRASFLARHARQIDEIKKLATEAPAVSH